MTESDETLAERLAQTAGELLIALQRSQVLDGKPLGAAGDAVAHHFLVEALRAHRRGDAVLSEEGAADPARLSSRRVWIVDPLDGTREFSEGRADWAVHVGLAVDGHPALGAVSLPALGLTLSSGNAPISPRQEAAGPLRIVVSRTRPPEQARRLEGALGAKLQGMGSAGAKAMAVVRGEADAYVHAGGQYEWDSCAPVSVALGAGLHASRLDGSPLVYNRTDPYLPDLLVCRPEIADDLLAALNRG